MDDPEDLMIDETSMIAATGRVTYEHLYTRKEYIFVYCHLRAYSPCRPTAPIRLMPDMPEGIYKWGYGAGVLHRLGFKGRMTDSTESIPCACPE